MTGRPPINENFADRYGTFHSLVVKPNRYGEWQALARVCYLTPDGDWKWVNRRSDGATPEEAERRVRERVFDVIGCVDRAVTNERTEGLHRGHQHVSQADRKRFRRGGAPD